MIVLNPIIFLIILLVVSFVVFFICFSSEKKVLKDSQKDKPKLVDDVGVLFEEQDNKKDEDDVEII